MTVKLVGALAVERENSIQYMASKCPCKRDEQLHRGSTCDRRILIAIHDEGMSVTERGRSNIPRNTPFISSLSLTTTKCVAVHIYATIYK